MKAVNILVILFVAVIAAPLSWAADEKPVFGPKTYEVRERFGLENRSSDVVKVREGRYMLKLQNGTVPLERPDFLEVMVNGEKVLQENPYLHAVIACYVTLKKENTLTVMVRDAKPSGMRRPAPTPKSLLLTVTPARLADFAGAYGAASGNDLQVLLKSILSIRDPEARSRAEEGANLRNDLTHRTTSLGKLAALKERTARDFLLFLYTDMSGQPEVRAEAATALGVLGDNTVIPTLMREIVNPNDLIRTATARALSLYPEEETAGPLTRTLTALDSMRMGALIRSLTAAGWKPVGVVLQLADSSDPYVVGIAVEILGGLQESRATDRLLALFADPGSRDLRPIISALGQSRDLRALDPLLKLAADPKRRAGKEAVVGEALADLGDQRGAAGITEMIRKSPSDAVTSQLKASCRKLTGRECR
ncbi:MAG: hypothetical protein A2X56_11825 [Nitrospirae bacterium GWC2_57_13]|jgi:HEAT repeat protein|nr:MAG: hypothetical protein A2X56_11825 [Nitrospirae bacterium GWC2_57_13]HAR45433.1 hypothetical protein [Nitrospiraceae bacterium]HAS54850.1 hypothetical protein [Nitrospiraceae bacterium]